MTDEEENKCLTKYEKLFCANCEADCTISILDCYDYQLFFKGYEQGYEDCRHYAHDYYKPKWHDLRKDPNDLPKENGDYYVCLEDKIHTVQYWNNNHWCFSEKPIAWCELPQFKE